MEIRPEYDLFRERFPNLSIDPHLLVQTPLHNVLYVTPSAPELRNALREGLENARANGAFDALYEQLYGHEVRTLNLDQRRVLTLGEPSGR